MNTTTRSSVLVIGEQKFDATPFIQRRLTPVRVKLDQLGDTNLTNCACGVLLLARNSKLRSVQLYFEKWFFHACELGLLTAICGADPNQVVAMRDKIYAKHKIGHEIGDLQKRSQWQTQLPWVFAGEEEWELAEQLARHHPGPPLGSPKITYLESSECSDCPVELLLKRAFHDSVHLTVRPLSGGRTAKGTFCVFARLDNGQHGPQPIPFFVKIDGYEMIRSESNNYKEFVEPFIPYHLHPSVDVARGVTTLTCGMIVCDFVENATPLRDALRAGQADGVIYSLFETTLRGLRANTQNRPPMAGVLEAFLDARVRSQEIEANHPLRIRKLRERGMLRSPIEIEASLRARAGTLSARQGPYHGDLHYSNVMVRHRDAIVIDFASMKEFGPLYADPAILEVSLVFGTDRADKLEHLEAWCSFVDHIYTDLLRPPLPIGDHPHFAWLQKAVRELRQSIAACGIEKREALITLAGSMLRYARNPILPSGNSALDELAENRRSYALVTAYRLCERLENQDATR